MPDPNDPNTPPQGNPAANGNGNGQKARVAELEKLVAEREAALVERDRRLQEARELRTTQEEAFRAAEREAQERIAYLQDELRRLQADNDRLRSASERLLRGAPSERERVVTRDDPRRWRSLSRLCATIDGKARTIAAETEFDARQSDLEDDGLTLGVDFVHATAAAPATPAAPAAPGR